MIQIPDGFTEKEISVNVCDEDLAGCFLYNEKWGVGGFFQCSGDHGFVLMDNSSFSTFTGENLYDHITINGFKVYKKQ